MALGIAKDEPESIVTLARAGSAADILVTIGGASVGEYDLVAAALKSEGLELDFWKIAMRPGKPLLFGRMGNQSVLGVPGNPVSALICAHVFLMPMLDKLLGASRGEQPRARGRPRRGACRQRAARALHAGALGVARRRDAGRDPPALAGLLAGGGARPRRLPDRAAAAMPLHSRAARGSGSCRSIAVKGPETRITRRAAWLPWRQPPYLGP